MRPTFRLLTLAGIVGAIILTLLACGSEKEQTDMKRERQEVKARIEAALDRLNNAIDAMQAELDTAGNKTAIETQMATDRLNELKYSLWVKSAEASGETEEKWDQFKAEVDSLLSEIDRTLNTPDTEAESEEQMTASGG